MDAQTLLRYTKYGYGYDTDKMVPIWTLSQNIVNVSMLHRIYVKPFFLLQLLRINFLIK